MVRKESPVLRDLRDAWEGEGNKIPFKEWLVQMAENPHGTLRDAAKQILHERWIATSHFFQLVITGKHRGCSTSERDARTLAKSVLDHALSLDGEACQGLRDWIDFARKYPNTARDMLEG